MKKKHKITHGEQKAAADIITKLIFAKTMKEVQSILEETYEYYELNEDPFTKLPCTNKEYSKNYIEYQKQAMIEKYGHCDGLE